MGMKYYLAFLMLVVGLSLSSVSHGNFWLGFLGGTIGSFGPILGFSAGKDYAHRQIASQL